MARTPSLFADQVKRPLAERLRPQKISDVVGQDHLLAPNAPLGRMLASNRWRRLSCGGTPGCGKTTIARLLAAETGLYF